MNGIGLVRALSKSWLGSRTLPLTQHSPNRYAQSHSGSGSSNRQYGRKGRQRKEGKDPILHPPRFRSFLPSSAFPSFFSSFSFSFLLFIGTSPSLVSFISLVLCNSVIRCFFPLWLAVAEREEEDGCTYLYSYDSYACWISLDGVALRWDTAGYELAPMRHYASSFLSCTLAFSFCFCFSSYLSTLTFVPILVLSCFVPFTIYSIFI